ncbi:MAG: peptidoglycan DD-metalloendopeptidase family protein [Porticoccaceae bacterium]|nr:peptidoglycan DD-metalloendopeptidase family protein [Porticoccaceae bacterium]
MSGLADDPTQQQLDELKRTISSLEKALQQRDQERDSLQSELKTVELETALSNSKIRRLRSTINDVKTQLTGLNQQQTALQKRINRQTTVIVEQIAAAYKLGNQEPLKLLLNQEDPQQIARVFKYYDYFLQARSEKIAQYKSDVQALTKVIDDISSRKLSLTESQNQLQAGQQRLANQIKARQQALAKVNLSLRSDQQKLSGLQKQRSELEEILSAVVEAVSDLDVPGDYQPFDSLKGQLQWPLKGPVSNSFGSRRSGELRWQGWMIRAKNGDEVQAVHQGRVVFSNYLRGFGLLVIVDHADGYMTLYAHNQELLKETGSWVFSGETISRAGDTGGLDSPALYFEIRNQGTPTDPKIWLGKR